MLHLLYMIQIMLHLLFVVIFAVIIISTIVIFAVIFVIIILVIVVIIIIIVIVCVQARLKNKCSMYEFNALDTKDVLCLKCFSCRPEEPDEDVEVGRCLEQVGVQPYRTVDKYGRETFHPWNLPKTLFSEKASKYPLHKKQAVRTLSKLGWNGRAVKECTSKEDWGMA
jgi:hypothetical protein